MVFCEYHFSDFYRVATEINFTKEERDCWSSVDTLAQTLKDFLSKKEANNHYTIEQVQDLRFVTLLRTIVYIQKDQLKEISESKANDEIIKSIYEKVNKLADIITIL